MKCSLPNFRQTLSRWSQPSTWLILGLAVAYFAPGLYETHVLRQPWVSSDLVIEEMSEVGLVIKDTIKVTTPVSGDRLIWMENTEGARICGSTRDDAWVRDELRIWGASAFFNDVCKPPTSRWRACSQFAVITNRGGHGLFGPFCSQFYLKKGSGPQ